VLLHRIIEKIETDTDEIQIEFIGENESPSNDFLDRIELDRRLVKKIRTRATLFAELFDSNTEYIYKYPFRTRFEVEGGYKVARRRGARLDEVNVYNLIVRFRNSQFDNSEARAFMYRPRRNNMEWIVLLPDDTEETIEEEIQIFESAAKTYAKYGKLTQGLTYEQIVGNLKLLNLHERCAQTLMHEYGHVLHWRIFDRLGDAYNDSLAYRWFLEHGYAQLIDRRVPNYYGLNDERKLWLLKECLVEDYRISLNLNTENGMFILPGKYTFSTDLRAPRLLKDGVNIMQRMLKPAIENTTMRRRTRSNLAEREKNDLDLMLSILEASMDDNWTPGQQRMTIEEHHAVIQRLEVKESEKQVSASLAK